MLIPPKRIVLTTFGSYGDIHPYMAIALELQHRGHSPVIATSALYRAKIEAAGLEFCSVRPDLPPPQDQDQELIKKVMEPKSGARFLLGELIVPYVRDSYADLIKAVKGADLLITHPLTFAGPLVARKIGIRWASVVLSPASFLSAYDPPVPPFWPWLWHMRWFGAGFMKLVVRLIKQISRQAVEPVDQLSRDLGLPDAGHPLFEGQHSTGLVLALFSSLFAEPQPDWPPQTRVAGFAFYDGRHETPMPAELSAFLQDGPNPIVFTLGSSAVWIARDFFHESIAAIKQLDQRAVLLIGDERNLPLEALPSNIIAVNYAPYELLLERASIMVHHGGVGTTSQGLRAGIPTLIVPFAFDQADNAAHAARLGTSRTLDRRRYRADRVRKELEVLLNNPRYGQKARRVGEYLGDEHGAFRACDLIEDFLRTPEAGARESDELLYASGD